MSSAHPGPGTVGVRELRQNLSKYLERVKEGETLTVTERGHEVARLVPSGRETTPGYRRLAEKLGASVPKGDLLAVIDGLPPGRSRPDGTTDAFLDESRGERV